MKAQNKPPPLPSPQTAVPLSALHFFGTELGLEGGEVYFELSLMVCYFRLAGNGGFAWCSVVLNLGKKKPWGLQGFLVYVSS